MRCGPRSYQPWNLVGWRYTNRTTWPVSGCTTERDFNHIDSDCHATKVRCCVAVHSLYSRIRRQASADASAYCQNYTIRWPTPLWSIAVEPAHVCTSLRKGLHKWHLDVQFCPYNCSAQSSRSCSVTCGKTCVARTCPSVAALKSASLSQ